MTGMEKPSISPDLLNKTTYGYLWFYFFSEVNLRNPLLSGAWGRTRTGTRYCLEGF